MLLRKELLLGLGFVLALVIAGGISALGSPSPNGRILVTSPGAVSVSTLFGHRISAERRTHGRAFILAPGRYEVRLGRSAERTVTVRSNRTVRVGS